MPEHPIVDAHVHLINPSRFRYSWLNDVARLNRAWLLTDFAAEQQPPSADLIVVVEADVRPDDRMAEARWIAALATGQPIIGGMVASLPVERGVAIEEDLDRLQGTGILSGVRRPIQAEPDPRFCLQPGFLEGLRLLGERGVPFDIGCYHDQLPAVAEMVRACPDTLFVLDHMGRPPVRGGRLDPWRADLERVAARPNVVCKICGVANEAGEDWSRDGLLPYIRHAAAAFEDGRILFGSDWPVSTLAISRAEWVEVLDELFADWPEPARRRFWRETARRVYRLAERET